MPVYLLYLLQLLDVGCFSPIKKAYGGQIENLICVYINHITKTEFLLVFKAAFDALFTKSNIRASFQGAGLVLFDLDTVILCLDVRLCTPTPPTAEDILWESKTPSNPTELGSQSALLCNRIINHLNSLPTGILESLNQLTKGSEMMMATIVLLHSEVAQLWAVNEAATRCQLRKRKRIQQEGILTYKAGSQLVTVREVADQQKGRKCRSRDIADRGAPG